MIGVIKYNNFYSSVIVRNYFKIFRRKCLSSVFVMYCFIILFNNIEFTNTSYIKTKLGDVVTLRKHYDAIGKYFSKRRNWNTSNLGSALFKIGKYDFAKRNGTFLILAWKHWELLKKRHHITNMGQNRSDQGLLTKCSVDNCIFTGTEAIDKVDVVLVLASRGFIPDVRNRSSKQIWVFLNDESPTNAFNRKVDLKTWANVFNWSMTYRIESDVPVPYGRTVPLAQPVYTTVTLERIANLIPCLREKQKYILVTVMMSNCRVPFRMKYLKQLQKYIKIDVYGKCSKNNRDSCPGHFKKECNIINRYYFYLALENSICPQYLTEKVFHNAYLKGAIPIIVGPSSNDSKMLLPPKSYIHWEDYQTPEELANKIINTIHNITEYMSYHMWRNHFEVLNEHGHFGSTSYHMCRLCEALNYNNKKEKIYSYEHLRLYLDPNPQCKRHL